MNDICSIWGFYSAWNGNLILTFHYFVSVHSPGVRQSKNEFYVLLTVHLDIIFVNNQLDAQFFFMYIYFYSLQVSGSHVPIIRRINCINTSGICHSVQMTVWCPNGHLYRVTYTRCIDTILLMMGTWLPETCRE